MPRWVKVSGLALIVVLLFVVMHLVTGTVVGIHLVPRPADRRIDRAPQGRQRQLHPCHRPRAEHDAPV
jgi:hypothetical protein